MIVNSYINYFFKQNRVEDNPVLTPLIDAIDNWLTNNPPGAPEANITAGAAVLLQDPAVFFPGMKVLL